MKRLTFIWVMNYVLLHVLLSSTHANQLSSQLDSPNVHSGKTPFGLFANDDKLWVVFVYADHVYITYSVDYGVNFSPVVQINQIPEEIYSKGENRPKLAIDDDNRIFVTWTKKTTGFYTGEIRFSRSLDNGKHFSEPITVHDNLGVMGHRFDNLNLNSDGVISIAWLDKRDKYQAKKEGRDYRGISVYYTWSDDHGESFQPEVRLANHSCECCRIASVTDQQDNLHLLWRHIFAGSVRDHALLSISAEHEVTRFARASIDNWQTDACPHHGPAITTDNEGRVYYSWFSQGTINSGIMFTQFDLERERLGTAVTVTNSMQASHPDIVMHNKDLIHVWKYFDGEHTHINGRSSQDSGQSWSTLVSLSKTRGGSDHPQIITTQDHAYLAWHTNDEGYRLIKIEVD